MDEINDKTAETVGLVNHLWLTVLSHAELKEQVQLNHVNHMWDDDRPYWYLWLNDCLGVYKMELQRSTTTKGYDWIAEFTVKYYPSRTEPSFKMLSTLERLCRTSEMFHSLPSYGECGCPCNGLVHSEHQHKIPPEQTTGAPDVRFNEIIPARFFYAGSMWIAFNSQSGSIIRLQSQTSWKTVIEKDFTLKDDADEIITMLKKGKLDRDYPGYSICELLYRRVVKSWSFIHHYAFQDESSGETDGYIFYSDGYNAKAESSSAVKKMHIESELHCSMHDKLDPFPLGDSSMIMKSANGESSETFTVGQGTA